MQQHERNVHIIMMFEENEREVKKGKKKHARFFLSLCYMVLLSHHHSFYVSVTLLLLTLLQTAHIAMWPLFSFFFLNNISFLQLSIRLVLFFCCISIFVLPVQHHFFCFHLVASFQKKKFLHFSVIFFNFLVVLEL